MDYLSICYIFVEFIYPTSIQKKHNSQCHDYNFGTMRPRFISQQDPRHLLTTFSSTACKFIPLTILTIQTVVILKRITAFPFKFQKCNLINYGKIKVSLERMALLLTLSIPQPRFLCIGSNNKDRFLVYDSSCFTLASFRSFIETVHLELLRGTSISLNRENAEFTKKEHIIFRTTHVCSYLIANRGLINAR